MPIPITLTFYAPEERMPEIDRQWCLLWRRPGWDEFPYITAQWISDNEYWISLSGLQWDKDEITGWCPQPNNEDHNMKISSAAHELMMGEAIATRRRTHEFPNPALLSELVNAGLIVIESGPMGSFISLSPHGQIYRANHAD